MTFQIGNKSNLGARKDKPVDSAIRRALAQDSANRLRNAIEKLLDKAAKGDLPALAWLADRTDGKAVQAIEAVVDAKVEFQAVLESAEELRKKVRGAVPGL
jgi:hypothetical protein